MADAVANVAKGTLAAAMKSTTATKFTRRHLILDNTVVNLFEKQRHANAYVTELDDAQGLGSWPDEHAAASEGWKIARVAGVSHDKTMDPASEEPHMTHGDTTTQTWRYTAA